MEWQGRPNKITSGQPRKSEMHFIPHTHLYQKQPLGFQSHCALVTILAHFIHSELFRKSMNAWVILGGSRMKSELEEYIFITLPQSPLVVAYLRISSHLPFHDILLFFQHVHSWDNPGPQHLEAGCLFESGGQFLQGVVPFNKVLKQQDVPVAHDKIDRLN